jgi:2-keto-3-deoxygluconate permease
MRFFGLDGIWGINAVAFITAMCSVNPGVYMGLIAQYGEPEDYGGFAIQNLIAAPAIPILIITSSSGAGFQGIEVLSVFIPLVLGIVLGNLDANLSMMYSRATPIVLPFLGCCFGASLNFLTAIRAGAAGIILSAVYLVIHCVIMLFTDKVVARQPGYASMAMCSIAGIAMVIPFMLGPAYAEYQDAAVAQIACAMVITSIISPLLTKMVVRKWGCPQMPKA